MNALVFVERKCTVHIEPEFIILGIHDVVITRRRCVHSRNTWPIELCLIRFAVVRSSGESSGNPVSNIPLLREGVDVLALQNSVIVASRSRFNDVFGQAVKAMDISGAISRF